LTNILKINKMRHGSLFSGIGGFDLAADWMGWENVFHCEWNPFGQKVLKHYWPNSISYNDITKTALLIGMEGWYSKRCRLIWKLKGTKSNRMYFQLRPLTLHTEEIGFGLLPTITASDSRDMPNKLETGVIQKSKSGAISFVRNKDGMKFGASMREIVKTGMLCTPTAQASRGNTSHKRGKGNLTDQIAEMNLTTSKTSQINPQFVMEMMGFPTDWTELPFLNGETSQSKQEEMP